MATPPVAPHANNATHDDETEGSEKPSLTPNNEAMLDHLFCSDHVTKKLLNVTANIVKNQCVQIVLLKYIMVMAILWKTYVQFIKNA